MANGRKIRRRASCFANVARFLILKAKTMLAAKASYRVKSTHVGAYTVPRIINRQREETSNENHQEGLCRRLVGRNDSSPPLR